MRPVVEKGVRRVLRFNSSAGEGDPEQVGQEGGGHQSPELDTINAPFKSQSSGKVGSIHDQPALPLCGWMRTRMRAGMTMSRNCCTASVVPMENPPGPS